MIPNLLFLITVGIIKKLDMKYRKELGFNLLDLYEIAYVENQSRIYKSVKYSFLIKKSHLNDFKKISFSKRENKFLIRNDDGDICWKLPYYKENDYINPYELPCIIRVF